MKKLLATVFALSIAHFVTSQTVLPGSQEIDKAPYQGLYVTTKIDDKYLERYWEQYLKQFGKVSSSRGSVYRVSPASISNISTDPINLASKVSSSKGISQVFIYLDLGNGTYVTQGSKGYSEAEAFLKQFAESAILQDEARVTEEAMKDSEKGFNKLTRNGEGLKKDIEKATRKLADLNKELEANIKDVATAQTDLEAKKVAFDAAKAKIPTKN